VGFWGDLKVNNPPPSRSGVEQLERRRGDHEHFNRCNVWKVVAQKAPPGRGGDRHGIHRPTVAWLMLMPSLSSSPWMRGAPHNGLAVLMRRMKSRISGSILARLQITAKRIVTIDRNGTTGS
jgi:hypothetical protein